jgi:hypothetical protein
MRTVAIVTALAIAAAGLAAAAHAQSPLPLEPEPDFSRPQQCTRDHLRSVQSQVEALEKLRTAGPEAVGRICGLIEMGSAWLGGELPDDLRRELRSLLGFDVDLERLITQCRTGQDAFERELIAKLARLRAEQLRCETI